MSEATKGEGWALRGAITWRSMMILLFVVFLLAPMDTFLQLCYGSRYLSSAPGYITGVPALWVTILLFAEISRLFGKPLTREETWLVYMLFGTAMTETFFIDILFQGYHKSSILTTMFTDPRTGQALSYVLPSWYAPPLGSSAYNLRSFLHPDWLIPTSIVILSLVFGLFSELGLGLLCAYLYTEVEKLPYPTAPLASESILIIAEREPAKVKVFTIGTLISLIWSTFSFGLPMTMGDIFGLLTFVDLTTIVDKAFPGVVMGIIFEPFAYTYSWLLSPTTIISMFIGSYAIWVVGDWLVLRTPSSLFTQFQQEYTVGSPASLVISRSTLHIWTSVFIGASIGLAIPKLIQGRRYLISSLKSLTLLGKASGVRTGYPPLPLILALWLGGLIGSTALVYILVPDFPIWTLILFVVALPFIAAMISARGMGETGFGVSIPNMKELAIVSSGYTGAELWFMPLYPRGYGTGAQAAGFSYIAAVGKATGTRFMDYVKSMFILIPLTVLMSFFLVSLFWAIAPIPSSTYPATTYIWPSLVMSQNFTAVNWVRLFKPELMLGALVVLAILSFLSGIVHIPYFSPVALVAGFTMPPYTINSFIIGYLMGVYLIEKKLGKEWWQRYKAVLLAGITCGYGIIATVVGASSLLSRVLWYSPRPY